jgi:ATP-dependent protease ClpP protease subunit
MLPSSLLGNSNDLTLLTAKNTVVLRDSVNAESVARVSQDLLAKDAKTIYLYITSPGGVITEGLRLINVIEGLQRSGKSIICITDYAVSMAFSLLQTCSTRLIVDNAVLMQHQTSYSTGMAPALNQKNFSLFIDSVSTKLHYMDAKRLGLPLPEFLEKIRSDWWLFDKEIISAKAADRFTSVSCSKDLVASEYMETIRGPFGEVSLTWSSCPLIQQPVRISKSLILSGMEMAYHRWAAAVIEERLETIQHRVKSYGN